MKSYKAVSIIIPVYNVQKYLNDCIESVVGQTLADIEIILVDDGSTDNSGNMCEEWKKKDNRITVYHKENGGLMSAWKYGVKHANGEYIGFVDSDDWVDSNMFETLLDTAVSNDVDLVCCGLIQEFSDGSRKFEKINFNGKKYSKNQIENDIFPIMLYNRQSHGRMLAPNKVTKLYKRELLLSVLDFCSDSVSIGEDLLTTFNYINKIGSVIFLPDFHPYHYRINSDSMIQKFSSEKYKKITELKKFLMKSNDSAGYDFAYQINADYIQLMLNQLDCEILFSGESSHTLKENMKQLYNYCEFSASVNAVDVKTLPNKQRLYLTLLKHKLYGLLIFIRRSKR